MPNLNHDVVEELEAEIDRLRALLLKIRHSRLSKLDAWEWLMFEIDEALRDE
jgi:hypothetical protein